jgi:hypothetical protein
MYPVKQVSFGHTEGGTLVRFTVQPRGRQMLLQRVRDGLPMIADIVLTYQPKGRQPVEIAPEEIDWTDSDVTPTATWGLPGDDGRG